MTKTAKRVALRLIESMPADASLEEIMYELYFRHAMADLMKGAS